VHGHGGSAAAEEENLILGIRESGMNEETDGKRSSRFTIYRGADAKNYAEHNVMPLAGLTATMAEGLKAYQAGGGGEGQVVKLLYGAPGFSLTHVWFKSAYPLPVHSHNCDCLYYIISGSVQIGRETLSAGDGFFIGADVAYTYVPGPQGVEVLEFRNTDTFNISFKSDSKETWEKAAATLTAQRAAWSQEPPPSQAP
jgi:mannose-6-phosphate isomerase-like protein (cupin superfamily)